MVQLLAQFAHYKKIPLNERINLKSIIADAARSWRYPFALVVLPLPFRNILRPEAFLPYLANLEALPTVVDKMLKQQKYKKP